MRMEMDENSARERMVSEQVEARERRLERLDLQAIYGHDRVALVHQVMGQGVSGWPESHNQHAAAACRLGAGR